MGWEELEQECLQSSQRKWDVIADADVFRTESDPGDSADESSGTPLSQGGDSPWWVPLLLKHVQHYMYQDIALAPSIKLMSGCSGMLAEAFALQARCTQSSIQTLPPGVSSRLRTM